MNNNNIYGEVVCEVEEVTIFLDEKEDEPAKIKAGDEVFDKELDRWFIVTRIVDDKEHNDHHIELFSMNDGEVFKDYPIERLTRTGKKYLIILREV